jgi:hypothetical protein
MKVSRATKRGLEWRLGKIRFRAATKWAPRMLRRPCGSTRRKRVV